MKTYLAALAVVAALAQPASAITFSKLTTIYIGAGAIDNGGASFQGTATVIICSNVSGVSANVRAVALNHLGAVKGQFTTQVQHGATAAFLTHTVNAVGGYNLQTGVFVGVVNVESTQSGVFCNGSLMNGADGAESSAPLHLVRVNPHPGTVE